MKFEIPSKLLFTHLSALSKVINTKNTISILDNFLFTLEGEEVVITGSDQETTMTTTISVINPEGNGSFAVNVKNLLDLLKELPDQPLRFEIDDARFEITLYYQNGKYNFVGIDGQEFPREEASGEEKNSFLLPVKEVKRGIEKTLFAVGQDEIRRIMMGILWDIKPDMITFVASDTHKLVRYQNKRTVTGLTASFILPTKPASILNNILPKGDGDVKISIDTKSATFELEGYTLTCRFINGKYPNYNSVIPQNNPYKLLADRQSLLNAVRRVSVFASTGGLVRLDLQNNNVMLKAQDVDFSTSAEETLACEYEGENMMIGFNDTKTIEILNNIDSDNIMIMLSDPSRAGVFLPETQEEGEDLLVLLMPMMI